MTSAFGTESGSFAPTDEHAGFVSRVPNSLSIAIFVYSLHGGGAERVASMLANGMAHGGDDITVVTETPPEGDQYALIPGVKRFVIADEGRGGNSWTRTVRMAKKLWRFRTFLRRRRPDVCLSLMTRCNWMSLLAAIGTGTPVVISERNDPRFSTEPKLDRACRRLLYPFAACLIAQTPIIENIVRDRFRVSRTRCIANPLVPPNPQSVLIRERAYLLAVGRLVEQKGFDVLLHAFASIRSSRKADLLIAGKGGEEARLREIAKELGVSDRVVFLGHVSDPYPLMAGCSAFVLSSLYEGFPNVLLEAMSLGRPVISTRFPSGAYSMINDGDNGLLVPVNDSVALAKAMDRLLEDEEAAARLGHNAAKSVKQFHADNIVAEWRELASSVAKGSKNLNVT